MDTWTKQMGLPYINVSVDFSGNHITLDQHRFTDADAKFDASTSPFG